MKVLLIWDNTSSDALAKAPFAFSGMSLDTLEGVSFLAAREAACAAPASPRDAARAAVRAEEELRVLFLEDPADAPRAPCLVPRADVPFEDNFFDVSFPEEPDEPEDLPRPEDLDADGSRTAFPYFAPSDVFREEPFRFLDCVIYTSCSVSGEP